MKYFSRYYLTIFIPTQGSKKKLSLFYRRLYNWKFMKPGNLPPHPEGITSDCESWEPSLQGMGGQRLPDPRGPGRGREAATAGFTHGHLDCMTSCLRGHPVHCRLFSRASLASTHQMSAIPPQVRQQMMSPNVAKYPPGKEAKPGWLGSSAPEKRTNELHLFAVFIVARSKRKS